MEMEIETCRNFMSKLNDAQKIVEKTYRNKIEIVCAFKG